ncbi:MAG: hypothetical protein HKO96_08220 [Flavobacteriaceae bacterium]|nr:hypothetical protein [Flavobacteriaceae bacterium]
MSKDPVRNNDYAEETDILTLLKYFENGILKIFRFFGSIFKAFYSLIIYSIKAVVLNIKLIVAVMAFGAIAGFLLENFSPTKYESEMLVRTYFDSQHQLATNIEFYNSLLSDENYITLKEVFKMEEDSLKDLLEFEIQIGPETENERIMKYDNFLQQLDSVRAQEISFDDFLEGRDILSGNLFQIRVVAKNKNIFRRLEGGILNSFQNLYSIKKKEKRDSLIAIQKINLREAIVEIDSLQNVYINVLEEESTANKASINLGQGFPLTQEKSDTKEYQLLNKEIELRERLRELDERIISEDEYFDVISGFPEVGSEYKEWTDQYMFLFPALGFVVLCIGFLLNKLSRYVRSYEG